MNMGCPISAEHWKDSYLSDRSGISSPLSCPRFQ